MKDPKWYASFVRGIPAMTAEQKLIYLEIADCIEHLEEIKTLVVKYIDENNIYCSESIWQRDEPQLEAIELADKLCKLIGYKENVE